MPHLWHRWRTVRADGGRIYQACRVCGKRRLDLRYWPLWGLFSRHQTDRRWLETGEWSDEWDNLGEYRTWV